MRLSLPSTCQESQPANIQAFSYGLKWKIDVKYEFVRVLSYLNWSYFLHLHCIYVRECEELFLTVVLQFRVKKWAQNWLTACLKLGRNLFLIGLPPLACLCIQNLQNLLKKWLWCLKIEVIENKQSHINIEAEMLIYAGCDVNQTTNE